MVPFCFAEIMQRRNNTFEMVTVAPIQDGNLCDLGLDRSDNGLGESDGTRLRLRGSILLVQHRAFCTIN